MRILIDDAAPATSKGARGRAATAVKRGRSPAGQIAVSCGPRKTGVDKECACAGIDLGDQPEHASAVIDALGVALLNRGCLVEGAKLVEQALRIRRKVFGDDHPTTALSFNSFARVLRERGELSGRGEDLAGGAQNQSKDGMRRTVCPSRFRCTNSG